jgi:Cation transport ATPase
MQFIFSINSQEVVVGDTALLEPGEIIPCDGVFLSGHNVKCDESGATGESDAIKKVSYDECLAIRQKLGGDKGMESSPSHTDCFVVSGSKVLEGVGSYVVVAVGTKSFNGRIMMGSQTISFFGWQCHSNHLTSSSWGCREYPAAVEAQQFGRVDRKNRQRRWTYSFHCPHDQVFRPAWN